MRKKRKSVSIQKSIYIQMFILLIATITGMIAIMRSVIITRLQNKEIELQLYNTKIILSELDNYMMTLMTKTDALFVSSQFIDLIESKPSNMSDQTVVTTQLRKMMDTNVFNLRYPEIRLTNYSASNVMPCLFIRNQYVYKDDEFIRDYFDIEDEPYIRELMGQRRMFTWSRGYSSRCGSYVAFNRRILSNRSLKDIAILQVRIPVSRIQAILNSNQLKKQMALYYLDDKGNIVFHLGESSLFEEGLTAGTDTCDIVHIKDFGKDSIICSTTSEMNEYRLICVSSTDPIAESISFVTPTFLAGGITAIVVGGISLYFLSRRLLSGINALIGKIRSASEGTDRYERMEPIEGTLEIELLDQTYLQMLHTINELHDKESRFVKALNQVQMELLQEQFNPHLLYNTLSMIRYLEDSNGASNISAVLDNLIHFYKRVLNRGQIITRIADEMDMIENYLAVVREVYSLDLDCNICVNEAINNYYTVKMFLQPIVENSIVHGIQQIGSGKIMIQGVQEGNNLHFTVIDDGIGIENERLKVIRQMINNNDNDTVQSYGYLSIAKRLKLFFEDNYRMEIESEPCFGTRVDVFIPAVTEDQISDILRTSII